MTPRHKLPINQDETLVQPYILPAILTDLDGNTITTPDQWATYRPHLLNLFADHVYGHQPAGTLISTTIIETGQALAGRAIRQQIQLEIASQHFVTLLLYRPADSAVPVPVFLGLNFRGNHTTTTDPAVLLTESWIPDDTGVADNHATEAGRGTRASRWPFAEIIARGYAVGTIYCGEISPDKDNHFRDSVHTHFYAQGQSAPEPTQWGTLAAWAWGLSRALDYLTTDAALGPVAVLGHSRLGKAALWAGATDTRFALTISNNSGCGGAALFKRCFGETIAAINQLAPYWFCQNFHQYDHREADLPLDQHMLLALIAPRPLYVASATEDLWADPRGEFLSAWHASAVYELFGKSALQSDTMPAPDQPIHTGHIGYHLRTGPHDITLYDWEQYMNFADQHLR